MISRSQILTLATGAILFVTLLYWYTTEIANTHEAEKAQYTWEQAMAEPEVVRWLESIREIPFSGVVSWPFQPFGTLPEKESIRLIYSRSFKHAYNLTITFTTRSEASILLYAYDESGLDQYHIDDEGKVIFQTRPMETYEAKLSTEQIEALFLILDEINFWNTPPGPFQDGCVDGTTTQLETNIGGNYKAWTNGCDTSRKLQQVFNFTHRIANQLSALEFAEEY